MLEELSYTSIAGRSQAIQPQLKKICVRRPLAAMPSVVVELTQPRKKARASSFSAGVDTSSAEYEHVDLLRHLQYQCLSQQKEEECTNNEYYGATREEFIGVFANVLQAIAENGDSCENQKSKTTIFYNANPPDISIYDYLQRYFYYLSFYLSFT